MKKIYLNGGLGNQIFQLLFACKLMSECDSDIVLDRGILDSEFIQKRILKNTTRKFELDKFIFDANVKSSSSFKLLCDFGFDFILKKLGFTGLICYEKDFIDHSGSDSFFGYWQMAENIKHLCGIDFNESVIDGFNKKIANEILNRDVSVSIHVRRSDYLTVGEGIYHELTSEYYNKIISEFDGASFYVFSDDIDWTKKKLVFNGNVKYIDHNTGHNSYLDMYLMSKCSVNVIANSTFSWWAAVLNKRLDKKVFSPNCWFLNQASELNLPSWNVVDVI